MFRFLACVMMLVLTACNSIYIKPNTLDKTQVFYASRGGYTMRRSIKERLEQRGYKVVVGKSQSSRDWAGNSADIEMDTDIVPSNVNYVIHVREREESFRPIWCVFNGFWWWNFNVSIADQKTGDEILTWRGRGCANSSLRKLDRVLDKLERE